MKPKCFMDPECYNVNNGVCSECENGIECMYNFMLYLNKQMAEAMERYNAESKIVY